MKPANRHVLSAYGAALARGCLPLLAMLAPFLTACDTSRSDTGVLKVAGGDDGQGAVLIELFDCGACHTIPGIDAATGTAGPPLYFWSRRSFIAGQLPNSPDNLVQWLMDPQSIDADTAMPDVGLSEQQARDVAAYLYTLE